jgi:hypothetical protein
MTRVIVLVSALGLALLMPARGVAYSDPATFGEGVDVGGGGGRYFTGSFADGFTCKVCHSGGKNPALRILGAPLTGYVPGSAYEITIEWRDDFENIALEAEIADRSGKTAGTLRLPPENELLSSELCLPVAAGVGAGMLTDLPTRSLLSLPDCGSRRLRFLWAAPARDVGPVWLTGSVVSGDAKGDVKGDGVTDFARMMPSPAAPDAVASRLAAGCDASARHGSGGAGLFALVAGVWLALRRRARAG